MIKILWSRAPFTIIKQPIILGKKQNIELPAHISTEEHLLLRFLHLSCLQTLPALDTKILLCNKQGK